MAPGPFGKLLLVAFYPGAHEQPLRQNPDQLTLFGYPGFVYLLR